MRPRFVSLQLIVALAVCAAAWSQGEPGKQSTPRVERRITEILDRLVAEGTTRLPNGAIAYTRVPPSREDIEEIRAFGDAAVPVLARFAESAKPSQQQLAINLLGHLGGKRIVEPLRKLVENAESPALRIFALRSLAMAPWEDASPIIRKVSVSDTSEPVRGEAEKILAGHK